MTGRNGVKSTNGSQESKRPVVFIKYCKNYLLCYMNDAGFIPSKWSEPIAYMPRKTGNKILFGSILN